MAEVKLVFDVIAARLEEDRESGFPEGHDADLTYCGLEMPIRFTVGDADMLQFMYDGVDNRGWMEIPLLGFALTCVDGVRELRNSVTYQYWIPGFGKNLTFNRHGMMVSVSSQLNGKEIEVPYDVLLEAFNGFKTRVADFVRQRIPELAERSFWRRELFEET